jgi:hypothetical protein
MGKVAIVELLGGIQLMQRKYFFLFDSITKLVPGFLAAAIAYPFATTPTIGNANRRRVLPCISHGLSALPAPARWFCGVGAIVSMKS